MLLAGAPAHAQLTNVDDAADVCPLSANPCIVTQPVEIVDGAVIDFGLRALEVRLAGVLDSGAGSVTVRAGAFTATTGENAAISAAGPIDGGSFTLEVVRGCSADATVSCVDGDDCQLGTCSASHCTGDPTRDCTIDEDCGMGLCSVGGGNADLDGVVDANGRIAGTFALRAAGDLLVQRPIRANAGGPTFDGGSVELVSGHSSITLLEKIEARGGLDAQGGLVTISAAVSLSVEEAIDVTGGDFDGGFLGIEAGYDILVDGDLLASAAAGAGAGGEISIVAGNDLTIAATRRMSADGSEARLGGISGDGGTIDLAAGNDFFVLDGVVVSADGAIPDGSGDRVTLVATRDLSLRGAVSARSLGIDGEGGDVALLAGGALTATSATSLDVRGGSAGGGSVLLDAGTDLQFAGLLFADADGGTGDRVALRSTDEVTITGSISIGGVTSGEGFDGSVDVTGCRISVLGGASIRNEGARGVNTFSASGGIGVQGSAQVLAEAPLGKNRFVIGPDSLQPVIQGTVSPAPEVVVEGDLVTCAECGNGNVDDGETCDDANQISGDGCTDCQDEGCIAQTLNWPDAPLCNDDVACTLDACNTDLGACENTIACGDAVACTIDSCGVSGDCLHEPDDGPCNDGNFCTRDLCFESAGCVAFEEDKPCDDGLGCTSNDACAAAKCRGVKNCADGSFCSNVTGACVVGETTTTTTNTTTTNSTTTTLATCGDGNVSGNEECDDGDPSWDFGEPCGLQCTILGCGDPDDDGDVRATDSLVALKTAVGSEGCAVCICDVDSSGQVTATDALALLRAAVGLPATPTCTACVL